MLAIRASMVYRPPMHAVDWAIILAYGVVVAFIGLKVGRGHQSTEEFFLGGRRIPAWAALCSMVATELSAATFIAVPQNGYENAWWYLQYAIGSFIARVVLATWFLSLYYRLRLVTVYGFLRQRFGRRSELGSAWLFIGGRLVASGSRLFIAALAFATVTGFSVEMAILLAGTLAMAYTVWGGIRAVIWTDTLQGIVFLVAAATALCVIGTRVAGGLPSAWETAFEAGRLRVFHFPDWLHAGTAAEDVWDWLARGLDHFYVSHIAGSTSFVVAVMGGLFLTLATHGTDQDMVQRLLTTRSSRRGGWALVGSGLVKLPLDALFLAVGTGLWVFYRSPQAAFDGSYDISDAERILPIFVMHEVPAGLRGLIFAGLFAAAMSSLDSALNSLATTWVVNIRPGRMDPRSQVVTTRWATLIFGMLLIGAAVGLVAYKSSIEAAEAAARLPAMEAALAEFQRAGEDPATAARRIHEATIRMHAATDALGSGRLDLISLALSSMSVFYGGLLGAFLVGLCTVRRGTDRSVLAGMLLGSLAGILLFLHPTPLFLGKVVIAWPWWIPIGAAVSFIVGALSRSRDGGPHP
jgi:SSS family transporter